MTAVYGGSLMGMTSLMLCLTVIGIVLVIVLVSLLFKKYKKK
jgi:ABC-type bacteriocin/lantibiotic exporter with double-glycine peptidase domain